MSAPIDPGPGRPLYQTPGTNLVWDDLASWCRAAAVLSKRRWRASRIAAEQAHLASLPLQLISDCDDPAVLESLLWWLTESGTALQQPLRGWRGAAPQTPLIVAAKNRLARLSRAADAARIPAGDNWRAVHGDDRAGD